jgi:hypothetical protein
MRKPILLLLFCLPFICFAQCGAGYVPPSFQLSKTDETCLLNNGSLSVINLTGGRPSYTFKIIAPSPYGVGSTNNTGTFSNLPPGQYFVQLEDSCGSLRVRQSTILPYSFSFTYNITRLYCDTGHIVITPSVGGNNLYATVVGNDTTWSTSPSFDFMLNKYVTVLMKDSCGNLDSSKWVAPPHFLPYIDTLLPQFHCHDWEGQVLAYGFTNPTYCMWKADWSPDTCNTTGIFGVHEYGGYHITVHDDCYADSFYVQWEYDSFGVQLDPYNFACNTFSMHVDGFNTLICLYDSTSMTQIACDSSGEFHNLPYGTYCSFIFDPCINMTFKVCSTVVAPFKVKAVSFPTCSIDSTSIWVVFEPESTPSFIIDIYKPDGTQYLHTTTDSFTNVFMVPVLPGEYTVVSFDSCGNSDTLHVIQNIRSFTKQVTIRSKCPGAQWTDGSGDIVASCSYNAGSMYPVIISKDGVADTTHYNLHQNNDYTFLDLEPAVYIIKYEFVGCDSFVAYDTVVINSYSYPAVQTSVGYQCGSNSFLLTLNSTGLGPFSYEIISSNPQGVVSAPQNNSQFLIYGGTAYSSIRIRTVDDCGNSALGDLSILPCTTLAVGNNPGAGSISNRRDSLIKIYPNPSGNKFNIHIAKKKKADYLIQIISQSGVIQKEQRVYNIDNKVVTIEGNFSPGYYVVKIINLSLNEASMYPHLILRP